MKEAKTLGQYFFVIRQLTSREIKRKYARSYLGIVWSVLNPLLSMAVLSLIFSGIFKRSIENYPVYYLTGYILWQLFTGATVSSVTALSDNKPLLLKVKFPMEIFVLTRAYTALINFFYSLIAYAVILAVFKITPRITMIFSVFIVFFLFIFSLGISLILSVLYVFFGDIKHLYTVFLTLLMYCSAIFYPADQMEGIMKQVVYFNPVFVFINSMRKSVMWGILPSFSDTVKMILWGGLVFLTGAAFFLYNKNKIMEKI